MQKIRKRAIVLSGIGFLLMVAVALSSLWVMNRVPPETRMGQVLEVREGSFLMGELPEMDAIWRIQVSLKKGAGKNAVVDGRGKPIAIQELPLGSIVEVTYTGGIAETYPMQILNAIKIQIVEKEASQ